MGPGEPPNVAGWPAYYLSPGYYQLWINSDTIAQRDSAIDWLLDEKSGINLKLDVLAFTAQLPNPGDMYKLMVDSIAFLTPVPLGPVHFPFLKMALAAGPDSQQPWPDLWAAYIAAPNDEKIKADVVSRLNSYYNYILKRPEGHLM